MPKSCQSSHCGLYSIKLQKSLYGLKQYGCMWYNRLSEYLIKIRYINDPIYLCVFIKQSKSEIAIVAVYVDDLNLIGTLEKLKKIAKCLNNEFEMKDLRKTKYYLVL